MEKKNLYTYIFMEKLINYIKKKINNNSRVWMSMSK